MPPEITHGGGGILDFPCDDPASKGTFKIQKLKFSKLCTILVVIIVKIIFIRSILKSDAGSEVDVLGVLRCDWTEMTAVTGVAVTPVIGYIRDDVSKDNFITTNPTEVDSWFSKKCFVYFCSPCSPFKTSTR